MRRREISPEFWTDERVVSVSDAAKLLFIGLWNLADRDGRLEDRPLTIGFKIRPWAPKEVPELLAELSAVGLIDRYTSAGVQVLCIPRFLEHQHPHPKEVAGRLPPPDHSHEKQRQAVEVPGEQVASPSGSSGSSVPSGSSGEQLRLPAEAVPLKPPKRRRPDPSDADPRHQPLIEGLVRVFAEVRGAKLPFGPRDAVGVKALLLTGTDPVVILHAWRKALQHRGYPTVSTPGELHQHLAHFVGAAPPARAGDARAPAPVPDWSNASSGEIPA